MRYSYQKRRRPIGLAVATFSLGKLKLAFPDNSRRRRQWLYRQTAIGPSCGDEKLEETVESSIAGELKLIKRVVELGEEAVVADGVTMASRLPDVAPLTAKIRALSMAMIGILAMPLCGLMAGDEILWEKLQTLIEAERPAATESTVLAVDTKGLSVRSTHASASTRELFEQAAMEHLARLHHTFNSWSERNQELMGSVSLKLTVDAAGNVARVEPVNAQVNNSSFIQTVIDDVRDWKFPNAGGATAEILVPLLFIPKGMDAEMIVQWERKVRGPARAHDAPRPLPVAVPPNEKTIALAAAISPPAPAEQKNVAAPPPSAVPPAPATRKLTVAAKPLPLVIANRPIAMRDNPRYSASSVREVDEATQLSILENRGDWLKVRAGGQIGFVRKEYVSPVNG